MKNAATIKKSLVTLGICLIGLPLIPLAANVGQHAYDGARFAFATVNCWSHVTADRILPPPDKIITDRWHASMCTREGITDGLKGKNWPSFWYGSVTVCTEGWFLPQGCYRRASSAWDRKFSKLYAQEHCQKAYESEESYYARLAKYDSGQSELFPLFGWDDHTRPCGGALKGLGLDYKKLINEPARLTIPAKPREGKAS